LGEDDKEPELAEEKHKAIDRADRRLSKRERESRFLVKRSEDYEVFDNVFDVPTIMTINDLRSDSVIESIKGSLAAGKESKVYLAVAPDGSLLTLKIYLTVSAEFKKRLQYIAGDPRFSDIKREFAQPDSRMGKKRVQEHAGGACSRSARPGTIGSAKERACHGVYRRQRG